MPNNNRLPKIHNERYIIQKRLGGGGFCEVAMAMDTETMKPFALKILDRNKPIFQKGKEDVIEKKLRTFMRREAQVMQSLNHQNIVKFYDIYENQFECFIVLEIINGGELYERIISKDKISETEARDIIRQLVDAVYYIHNKGFVHRDIKPENILLDNSKSPIVIKLADFGLSRQMADKMFTNCGTVDYCAPELLMNRVERKGYGKEVDNWSIGVVVYVTLSGYQPFMAQDRNEELLKLEIISGRFKFHKQYWKNISTAAKRFIVSVLKVDPEQRASIEKMLNHPWLSKHLNPDDRSLSRTVSLASN